MKKFIEQIKTTKCFTGKNGQFTTHHSRLTKKLSALVPQCLRTFCNGLLRFTRNDGLFTTHHSRLTQTAFTLAETLIVIGIIGVVAALTLPNLNHATGDKEKVTKVKKIYSALTDAVDRAQVIYGSTDTWCKDIINDAGSCTKRFAKRVTEFMKVSKDCGFNAGCFSTAQYLNSSGSKIAENLLDFMQKDGGTQYMVMLSDNVSLGFHSVYGTDYCYNIKVDIDGPNKGKNQEGNDIFGFSINRTESNYKNTLVPDSFPQRWSGDLVGKFEYVTAWVIENGNLDYLKCPDELNWETQTSCK